MIVTCTSCQSRFRVADDRIGPRGVKVRCSKCQTVFPVRPEGEALPAPPAGPSASGAAPPPLPSPRAGASLDLDLEPGRVQPAPDPFAPRADDPFAPGPDDPFASSAGAAAAPSSIGGALLADPWLASPAPAASNGPGPAALPVTDLSDLAGTAPPPSPPATAESLFGTMEGEGLSLEDRTTPPPLPAHSRADLFGGLDSHLAAPEPGDSPFGTFELAGSGAEPAPALAGPAGGSVAVLFEPAAAPVPQGPAPAPASPRPAPSKSLAPTAPESAAEVAERVRRRRRAAARSVAVNAVSLAVLLLAALALVVVLRGKGPIEIRSFRPAALFGALGRQEAGPVEARDVGNGLFDRARGAPLLYVRGKVVSRQAEPAVRVRVEVVRNGTVLASGEALAGALPTPEELWAAGDSAALEALSASLRARAARPVRAGEEVPFLVAIAEYPADLSGASLRVTAEPEGAPPRGSP
jgi:predicted Zn finger-like uncharacterized protein